MTAMPLPCDVLTCMSVCVVTCMTVCVVYGEGAFCFCQKRDQPHTLIDDRSLMIIAACCAHRAEVPHAVRVCQNAGITVRMVTGE